MLSSLAAVWEHQRDEKNETSKHDNLGDLGSGSNKNFGLFRQQQRANTPTDEGAEEGLNIREMDAV